MVLERAAVANAAAAATPVTGSWIPRGNDSPRLSGQLNQLVGNLQSAAALAATLTNIFAQMAVPPDYTTIELIFGLQPGQGIALHDVVGSVSGDLQGGNIQALLQRFG